MSSDPQPVDTQSVETQSVETQSVHTPTGLPIASTRRTLAQLVGFLGRQRILTVGVLLGAVAGAAFSLVPVLVGRRIIDAVLAGDSGRLGGLIGLILLSALAAALLTFAAEALVGVLSARLLADLRERTVGGVLSLPSATIERAGRGDALSRVGADVAAISTGLRTAVPTFISSAVMVVVATVGLLYLDWRLALAGLTAAPVYVWALRWYLPRSGPRYRELRRAEADHLDVLVGGMEGVSTLRAHGLEERRRSDLAAAAGRVQSVTVTAFSYLGGFVSRANAAEFTGLATLLLVGWWLQRWELVSVGTVAAAMLVFHRLFNPIGAILFTFSEVQRSGAALVRLIGVIDAAEGRLPSDPIAAEPVGVRIRGLRHRYHDHGSEAIAGVDLDLPVGTTLALVGASGAGKTTVASLIAGTLAANRDGGEIHFDDRERASLDQARLRGLVAVATQESHIFSGTLREDLLLAAPEAEDQELWAALARVELADWVRGLPQGLSEPVGAGGLIPDPMRTQQLALARIALSRAPVVVLDESTAEAGTRGADTLDTAARAAIGSRTAVIVAHRLSQAERADRVAVMAEGRIIECGAPADLIAADGAYARLWRAWHGVNDLAELDEPAEGNDLAEVDEQAEWHEEGTPGGGTR